MIARRSLGFTVMLAALLTFAAAPSGAKNTGLIFITNEKSSTLTVLNAANEVVKTVKTCARPRGMRPNADGNSLIIACGDDNTIGI